MACEMPEEGDGTELEGSAAVVAEGAVGIAGAVSGAFNSWHEEIL